MADLQTLLEEAVGDIAERDITDAILHRIRRRRRRRRAALAAATGALVAVIAGVVAAADRNAPQVLDVVGPEDLPTGQPVFSTATGVALLFDDGYQSVAALDLDSGTVGLRVVDGQRAGDQPFRLFRSGDSLIVGWGDVFAAPLDGASSVPLGEATIAIPAVETDRVWLATWAGRRIGAGELTLRQVDTDGRVIVEGNGPPDGGYPMLGVAGGLAFDSPRGLVLWDVGDQQVKATLPSGQALAATADRLVWCEGSCNGIRVLDLTTSDQRAIPLPEGLSGIDPDPANAALSPDGAKLAVFVVVPTNQFTSTTGSDSEGHIVVVDLDQGTTSIASQHRVPYLTAPRWSADGEQLFWATPGETTTEVTRYDVRSGRAESRRLLVPWTLRIGVVVDRHDARSFLPADIGSPNDCPPSGQLKPCGFRVTGASNQSVEVEDIEGVNLNEARNQLTTAGLELAVNDGDPDVDDAVVVAQEPPPGTSVPAGSTVGVRTTMANDELCDALNTIAPRTSDALQLAASTGFAQVLREARPIAPHALAKDIDTVLNRRDTTGRLEDAPINVGRALDRITIHHDACSPT